MTRHFATTAAAHLLPQLRVLVDSMRRHCRPFRLHVLAEGEEVVAWAREQDDVGVIRTETLLQMHPELALDRLPGPRRTPRECAITWRWWWALELVKGGNGKPLTVLDVDQMFWSSPEPVFEEIEASGARMAVLPHGFAPAALGRPGVTMESHRKYGLFNAGWLTFADPAPAAHFAELCREGPISEDRVHSDGVTRWGEQGGLEVVAAAHGAHVIQHPGAAPGPWSIHAQPLRRARDGRVFFGGRPLVAYHYHSFRIGQQLANPVYEVSDQQGALLYEPYRAALRDAGA